MKFFVKPDMAPILDFLLNRIWQPSWIHDEIFRHPRLSFTKIARVEKKSKLEKETKLEEEENSSPNTMDDAILRNYQQIVDH